MQINKHLSKAIKHDVFINTDGKIYLKRKSATVHIGDVSMSTLELIDNAEKHI